MLERIQGKGFIDCRDTEFAIGDVEALEILLGPKQLDATLSVAIGFQPLEYTLAVVPIAKGLFSVPLNFIRR